MDPRIDALLSILARYRDDLKRAFEAVPSGWLGTAPDEASWSVAQVLEHLVATERSVTKLLSGFVPQAPLRPTDDDFDPDEFARELDMPFVLDRSRPVKGSQPPGEMDAAQAWTALAASRKGLLDRMEEARGRRLEGFSFAHPATGQPLDAYQWIAFVGLHEGRHAEQIRAIVSRLDAT